MTVNESDRTDGVSNFSNGHQQQHSPSRSALTPAVDFLSSARAERGARGGRVAVVDALGGTRTVFCCRCLLFTIVLLFASSCFLHLIFQRQHCFPKKNMFASIFSGTEAATFCALMTLSDQLEADGRADVYG